MYRSVLVGLDQVYIHSNLGLINVLALLLIASCGVTMTTLSGNFYSPGYPAGYPRKANCIWEIDVPEGYYITLQFR